MKNLKNSRLLVTSLMFIGGVNLFGMNPYTYVNPNIYKMYEGVEENDINKVENAINTGININEIPPFGIPILLVAAPLKTNSEKDNAEVIRFLIARGANIEGGDSWNDTPLRTAALWQNYPAVEALLANGANINTEDQFGSTVFNISKREGQESLECFILALIHTGRLSELLYPMSVQDVQDLRDMFENPQTDNQAEIYYALRRHDNPIGK